MKPVKLSEEVTRQATTGDDRRRQATTGSDNRMEYVVIREIPYVYQLYEVAIY